METFGDRLKKAMGSERPFSLSKRTGISNTVLKKYLNEGTIPSIDKAIVLADALNVSLESLIRGDRSSPESERILHTGACTPSSINAKTDQNSVMVAIERIVTELKRYIDNNGILLSPESTGKAAAVLYRMHLGGQNIDDSVLKMILSIKA